MQIKNLALNSILQDKTFPENQPGHACQWNSMPARYTANFSIAAIICLKMAHKEGREF